MDGRDYYCIGIGIVQTWLRTEVVPFACMPVCMHMLCMDCIDPLLPVPILFFFDSIPKRVVCIFYLFFCFIFFIRYGCDVSGRMAGEGVYRYCVCGDMIRCTLSLRRRNKALYRDARSPSASPLVPGLWPFTPCI